MTCCGQHFINNTDNNTNNNNNNGNGNTEKLICIDQPNSADAKVYQRLNIK